MVVKERSGIYVVFTMNRALCAQIIRGVNNFATWRHFGFEAFIEDLMKSFEANFWALAYTKARASKDHGKKYIMVRPPWPAIFSIIVYSLLYFSPFPFKFVKEQLETSFEFKMDIFGHWVSPQ